MRKSIVALGVCCLLFAALSAGAAGAGGRIAGIVTDAKGAVVVGAAVTVTPSGGGSSRQAVTNKEGRYQIEDLPVGTYIVVVSATGFAGTRREEVAVTEQGVRLDVQLEVASLNAGNVEVKAAGTKPNAEPVYLDDGKGWTSLGSATITGNSTLDVNVPLAQAPKRAVLAALNDVLAVSIENNKN
ncbi:MAG TPA: carboxypeptidase-like regulatory domain-containing protein [Pyrinomonadaceae bacterium]|nr:carboxypeptidase-like regulatory domain-containing protein [Pyrinomonadaceae bacterium]